MKFGLTKNFAESVECRFPESGLHNVLYITLWKYINYLQNWGVNHRLKKLAIPKIQEEFLPEFQLKYSVSLNSLIFHFTGTNPDRLKFSGPQSITCFVLSIFVSRFFRMQKILMDLILHFWRGDIIYRLKAQFHRKGCVIFRQIIALRFRRLFLSQ